MEEKIKIIIADDNKFFCEQLEKYLLKYEDIEILGIAYTDEEEIDMIENLKPQIVITDLVRNHKYTGLEIIKDYNKRTIKPEFLVISADEQDDVINKDLEIGGYIKKPFWEYSVIIDELRKIHTEKLLNEQKQLIKIEQTRIVKIGILNKFLDFFKIRKREKC